MLSLAWWREVNVEQVDAVVIGAGVVGLAVGRALALSGREVLVLESENAIGTGTSSRNSEVIHAGIYYPAGSLKARLCVQGKQMLYAYCAERGVAHKQLGKLIVATSREQVLRWTASWPRQLPTACTICTNSRLPKPKRWSQRSLVKRRCSRPALG